MRLSDLDNYTYWLAGESLSSLYDKIVQITLYIQLQIGYYMWSRVYSSFFMNSGCSLCTVHLACVAFACVRAQWICQVLGTDRCWVASHSAKLRLQSIHSTANKFWKMWFTISACGQNCEGPFHLVFPVCHCVCAIPLRGNRDSLLQAPPNSAEFIEYDLACFFALMMQISEINTLSYLTAAQSTRTPYVILFWNH